MSHRPELKSIASLEDVVDPWRRVRIGLAVLVSLVVIGTTGYSLLGLGLFDALYQTVITISTVGFGEIGPEEAVGKGYRAFTMVLVLVGVGASLYTIGVLVESLLEGTFNDELRRRRMRKSVSEFSDHVVVCGWGRVGQSIAHYVARSGRQVVVIDSNPDLSADVPIIRGDATEDQVLLAAGIRKASTLVASLRNDADNLFVTLSARSLCPSIFIVARTSHQANEPKFFQAGADRVVNPHEIGGSRMAALALQPNVAEFLDEVLHDDTHDVAVHEVPVQASSQMAGEPLSALHRSGPGRALVIAIRQESGGYLTNPSGSTVLVAGSVLIAIGSKAELSELRGLVCAQT